MKNCLFAFALLVFDRSAAQTPVPAPLQDRPTLILGAMAHIGDGQILENSAIAFEGGKLTVVADARVVRIDRTRYPVVIEASGKHVWPGFVALDTRLGLVEVDAARATRDFEETGELNPNARAIVAYNADSEVLPTLRSMGILTAQICPEGGLMSGQSSVVQLDAWNWEDAAVLIDEGIHVNWPRRTAFSFDGGQPGTKLNEAYQKQVDGLGLFFAEASAYSKSSSAAPKNLRFEAMRGLFDGSKKLYLHADDAKSIQESALFAGKWGCKPVIVGGADAWLLADFLKTRSIPVVLSKMHDLPRREDDDIAQPFKTPAQLAAAGATFAISHDGTWRVRNLAFQAGQAAAFGLSREKALEAIALAPAKILGLEKRLGSLEIGKDATLFISDGDALDMRGCRVEKAFIEGRAIDLDDKQKELARKFEEKYRRQ